MKKILLGSVIALAVLTGCTEEKAAAPVATETTQEAAAPAVQAPETAKEEAPVAVEEKKEETK